MQSSHLCHSSARRLRGLFRGFAPDPGKKQKYNKSLIPVSTLAFDALRSLKGLAPDKTERKRNR